MILIIVVGQLRGPHDLIAI